MRVLPWLLLGIAIAIILYLAFRHTPIINNKEDIRRLDSTEKDNKFLRQFVNAQLNNFAHYKDSTTLVIDSLMGRNAAIKEDWRITEKINQSLADQIIHRQPGQSIDSPCIELAKKVLSDSAVIISYQHNTDQLLSTFADALNKRDTMINHQQRLLLSDSVLIGQQKSLYVTQEKQLKQVQRQGKTSAWIARSLAVAALVLGGILLSK